MKTKTLLALVAALFLFSGTAFAFHGGGVAHCDGCHSMHNSADNPREGSALAPSLMKGSDPSSTCLNCHNGSARYHISSAIGDNTNEGGDFFWIKETSIYDVNVRGNLVPNVPSNQGHNVIAFDYDLVVDPTNVTAPGGTFASNILGCDSCHDPHGQVGGDGTGVGEQSTAAISVSGSYGAADPVDGSIHGNYRILEDSFAAAPVARANSYDGASTDYGTGMSTWCLGCHDAYDAANMHPTADPVPLTYNLYVATGDMGGALATGKDALVPFARDIDDGSLLDVASTVGVDGTTDTVMCLSCHRAHASAFDNALRWDPNVEFLAESHILNEATTTLMAGGAVPYYALGAPVDIVATYGEWQRSLCNKCHVQD
ncbi:MAG: hypothetical protein OET08_03115 [Desulfuromonadales bacterium]|nr:hypothetical protein [Desulfuromonadales bacterium]